MLDALIRWSIRNRLIVTAGAALLLVLGALAVTRMPVDVFPDMNRPTVTLMVEAHGLAPEEVEVLVTFPLESVLNGATGVERVRSVSGVGLAIVWVEFDWSTPLFTARQIVAEKVDSVRSRLPQGVDPVLAPISSIMGEIMLLGLSSPNGALTPMQLRTLADWEVRPRLMAVSGVSQVTVMGGQMRQYQVSADPKAMEAHGVTMEELVRAVEESNLATSGGFLDRDGRELLLRNLGRLEGLADLEQVVVAHRDGQPIRVGQVARVGFAARAKRGDASVNGVDAVIMSVQKQPGANTVELTRDLDRALAELRPTLPAGADLEPLFRQSRFIETAIHNVVETLRDGSLLVALVLFAFLLNLRTTAITLTAIPLSFVVAALTLDALGVSINTMTLGGMAIAVGELVDDAIVDVENVHRRLRENRLLAKPRNPLRVVFEASREVRSSIVYATVLIGLVFLPLFFLGGVEGRLFQPLGLAYVIALAASLVVSLTVTPAMCSYLLTGASAHEERGDSPLVRWLKARNEAALRFALRHGDLVLGSCLALFLAALATVPFLGREFLPSFNEGTMTVEIVGQPGTSLEESNRLGRAAERLLMQIPEVTHVGRRTGRAELDEHAEGVHYSEIDVDLRPGRSRERILADIREKFRYLHGVSVNLGQPISHRLDHIMSGVRAQIAVKLFGPDLGELRRGAEEIRRAMAAVPGLVDVSVEKQVLVPQLQIRFDAERASRYGVRPGDLLHTLEIALGGETLGQVLEGQRAFDLVVRLDEPYRESAEAIGNLLVDTPSGRVPLRHLATLSEEQGPNQILREGSRRRIVISANVQGRDLGSAVQDVRGTVASVPLPPGAFVAFEGQFESQQSAARTLLGLSLVALAGTFLILYHHFRMARLALMVMASLPLAIAGGVLGVVLTGGTLSVASLVGFITLCGIASRNGIMRISHYLHLMRHEREPFGIPMIVRGSLERMVPVLMTALTAGLALVPLAVASGVPGKEILHPVAVVILTGLLTSTLLDTVATPVLFHRFGRPAAGPVPEHHDPLKEEAHS